MAWADGRTWIERLPDELAVQRGLLGRLLSLCERAESVRWLVIGCSVARGAGDHLSDLDVALGVRDEDFAAVLPGIRQAVDRLGVLVDSYHHQLPGVPGTHERIFAQYADGGQLDLVVLASVPAEWVPGVVILYDADGQLVITERRSQVSAGQAREWAFRGWCALADLAKYLRRGSWWEAHDRLHEARGQLWRLRAAALGVPEPQFGLTSILDFAPGQVPAGMERAVADLDPARLLSAARYLAAQLTAVGDRLPADLTAALPAAMGGYVTRELQRLAADGPARGLPRVDGRGQAPT